jgi:PAS domain S-box-containing protein
MKKHVPVGYKRATVSFMVVILISLAVVDFQILSDQHRTAMEAEAAHAEAELGLVATFITEPILRYEFSEIEQFVLQWGKNNSDIFEFSAVSPTGHILAKYRRPSPATHPDEHTRKVVFQGQHLLDLAITKDLAEVEGRLLMLKGQLVVKSIFITIIVGLLLGAVLKVLALRPLEAEIARRREAEEGLQAANETLEDRVRKRTVALTETNAELESEIAERRRAEDSLAAEKEHLAVTLRSIGDGVITTDIEGRVVLLNKVAEELTGWPMEEALGRPLGEVFYIVDEKTRARCESPVDKVLESGGIVGLANHTALISKDGTERRIADSGAPIRDRESRIVGVVLVFRDVTEKSRIEEELIKARKLETVGVLAGGIAHDFNNILTAILGNITLAAHLVNDEKEPYSLLMAAEKAAIRAKSLTQQLLTFSLGGEPVREAASVVEIIRDSATFVLHGGNVKCRFSIPEDLWLADIDKGQISQVIQNIIINARQAMPEGGDIEISCENFEKAPGIPLPLEDGRYVRILVTDRGVGIPEKILDRIFDPFFSTKQEGSGLGLAITHSIVTRHHGHIAVDSRPGEGSTFDIYLPVALQPSGGEGEEEAAEGEFEGNRVLIMDDEELVRDLLRSTLSHLGCEVLSAADGAEAISLYRRALEKNERIDMVIMDLTVPGGVGGREAIGELLALDPDARVIVSSGYSNDPVVAHFSDHGFRGTLIKPYRLTELKSALKKCSRA